MKKTTKKTLRISTQTIRALEAAQLPSIAGGYNSNIWCPPTTPYTCVPKTPQCPI